MLADHLLKKKKKIWKDFSRRTAFDKVLHDKAFNISKIPNYDRYQWRLASMVYNFFEKKFFGGAVTPAWLETLVARDKSAVKSEIMLNQHPLKLATWQLPKQLHKLKVIVTF